MTTLEVMGNLEMSYTGHFGFSEVLVIHGQALSARQVEYIFVLLYIQ